MLMVGSMSTIIQWQGRECCRLPLAVSFAEIPAQRGILSYWPMVAEHHPAVDRVYDSATASGAISGHGTGHALPSTTCRRAVASG